MFTNCDGRMLFILQDRWSAKRLQLQTIERNPLCRISKEACLTPSLAKKCAFDFRFNFGQT